MLRVLSLFFFCFVLSVSKVWPSVGYPFYISNVGMRCDDTVSASSLHRGRIVNHKENNNQQEKKYIIIIWKKRWSFTIYSLFALVNRVDCCAFLHDSHSQYFLYFSKKWIWEIQKQIYRERSTFDLMIQQWLCRMGAASSSSTWYAYHPHRIRDFVYTVGYNGFDLGISIRRFSFSNGAWKRCRLLFSAIIFGHSSAD